MAGYSNKEQYSGLTWVMFCVQCWSGGCGGVARRPTTSSGPRDNYWLTNESSPVVIESWDEQSRPGSVIPIPTPIPRYFQIPTPIPTFKNTEKIPNTDTDLKYRHRPSSRPKTWHRHSLHGIGVWVRGPRGMQPPMNGAKPVFFRQTLFFSGRSQQPKLEKKYLFFKRKSGIHSFQPKVPKIRDFYAKLLLGVSRTKQFCRLS